MTREEIIAALAGRPDAATFVRIYREVRERWRDLGMESHFPEIHAALERWPDATRTLRPPGDELLAPSGPNELTQELIEEPHPAARMVRELALDRVELRGRRFASLLDAQHLAHITRLDTSGANLSWDPLLELAAKPPFSALGFFRMRRNKPAKKNVEELARLLRSPMLSALAGLSFDGWDNFGAPGYRVLLDWEGTPRLEELNLRLTGRGRGKSLRELFGSTGPAWRRLWLSGASDVDAPTVSALIAQPWLPQLDMLEIESDWSAALLEELLPKLTGAVELRVGGIVFEPALFSLLVAGAVPGLRRLHLYGRPFDDAQVAAVAEIGDLELLEVGPASVPTALPLFDAPTLSRTTLDLRALGSRVGDEELATLRERAARHSAPVLLRYGHAPA